MPRPLHLPLAIVVLMFTLAVMAAKPHPVQAQRPPDSRPLSPPSAARGTPPGRMTSFTVSGSSITAMAVYETGNVLYVADDADGTIKAYDGATNVLLGTITGAGGGISALVINEAHGKLYAASEATRQITVINAATRAVLGTIDPRFGSTSAAYFQMEPDSSRGKIWVRATDRVSVIDVATDGITRVLGASCLCPYNSMAHNPVTNELYVPEYVTDRLTIVNGNDLSVTVFDVAAAGGDGPTTVEASSVNNKVYLSVRFIPSQANAAGILVLDRTTGGVQFVTAPPAANRGQRETGGQPEQELTIICIPGPCPSGGPPMPDIAYNPLSNRLYHDAFYDMPVDILAGATSQRTPVHTNALTWELGVRQSTDHLYQVDLDATAIIDGATGQVLALVPTGLNPGGGVFSPNLAINQSTGKVYVLNDDHNGIITVFDDASFSPPAPEPGCGWSPSFNVTYACTTAAAYEIDHYRFSASAGDVIEMRLSDDWEGTLLAPNGDGACSFPGVNFGITTVCTVTETGEFTFAVWADGGVNLISPATGAYHFHLQRLNSPVGCGSISVGGGAVAGNLTTAVDAHCYTFSATSGEQILVTSTGSSDYPEVRRPNGTKLCGPSFLAFGCVIDVSGTHTLVMQGFLGGTGSYTVTLGRPPELSLTKTHTGTFYRGQTGTYSLTVTNNGQAATISTINISDTLPAGMTYVSSAGASWSCGPIFDTVSCTRMSPALAPGESTVVSITVNIGAGTASSVTNTATVTTSGDPITANNTANDPTLVANAPAAPATPANLRTGSVTATDVPLLWDNVTDETSIQIVWTPSSPIAYTTVNLGADVTAWTHTPVTAGTMYFYHVRACNAVGCSGWSAGLAVTPGVAPATPSNLRAGTPVNGGAVPILWNDNATGESAYQVLWTVSSPISYQTADLAANSQSWNHAGAQPGLTYFYHVRACAGALCSPWSPGLVVTNAAPPAAPGNLRSTATTATSIDIAWDDNSSTETAMQVAYTKSSPVAYAFQSLAAGTTTWAHTPTESGATYYYHVRACIGTACSPWSGGIAVTSAPAPATPINFRAGTITAGSIQVLWDDGSGETSYQIARTPASPIGYLFETVGADATSTSYNGLTAATTYYFHIRACAGVTCSAWSAPLILATSGARSAATAAGRAPAAPTGVVPSPVREAETGALATPPSNAPIPSFRDSLTPPPPPAGIAPPGGRSARAAGTTPSAVIPPPPAGLPRPVR